MAAYERSVFINCPFDTDFEPLFHAIVLTVAALEFTPRCARESEGQAEPRILRIARGLRESKYSIHDLSRYQTEGPDDLPRFNMPLELGIALGIRFERSAGGNSHNWTALVPKNFVHHRFISDLAGYESPNHENTPETVIKSVARWLKLQPDYSDGVPSPKEILDAYPQYVLALDVVRINALGETTWPEILKAAAGVIAGMPHA